MCTIGSSHLPHMPAQASVHAGQSSSSQHGKAQGTAHCPTSAQSSEVVQHVPGRSDAHAWAEDSTAQYSALVCHYHSLQIDSGAM